MPFFGGAPQAAGGANAGGQHGNSAPSSTRRPGSKPSKEELAQLQAQLERARKAREAAQSGGAVASGGQAAQKPGLWSSLDDATRQRLLELRAEAQRQKRGGSPSEVAEGGNAEGAQEAPPLTTADLDSQRAALLAARDAARTEALRVVASSKAADSEAESTAAAAAAAPHTRDGAAEPLPEAHLEQLSNEQAQRDAAAATAAEEEADAAAASVRASTALMSAVELREEAEIELQQLKRQAAAFKARDAATKTAKAAAEARAQAAAVKLEQRREEEKAQQAAAQRRRAELELARLKLELEALRAQSATAAKTSAEKHAAAAALAAADVRRAAAASAAADAAAAARAAEDARTLERAQAAKQAAQAALQRLQAELEAARSGVSPPSASAPSKQPESVKEGHSEDGSQTGEDGGASTSAAGDMSSKQSSEPAGKTHLGRALQRLARARSAAASSDRFHAWMRTQGGSSSSTAGAGLSLPSADDGADESAGKQRAVVSETGNETAVAAHATAATDAELSAAAERAQSAAAAAAAAEAALQAVQDSDPEFDVDADEDAKSLTGEALAARRQAAAAHADAVSAARSAAAVARHELQAAQAELAGVREATRQVKRVAEERLAAEAAAQARRDEMTAAALRAVAELADRNSLPAATAAGALVRRLGNVTSGWSQQVQSGSTWWDSVRSTLDSLGISNSNQLPSSSKPGAADAPASTASGAQTFLLVAGVIAASSAASTKRQQQFMASTKKLFGASAPAAPGRTTSHLLLVPFDALSEAEQLRIAAVRASAKAKLTWGVAALSPPYSSLQSASSQTPIAANAAYCAELRRIATEWAAASTRGAREGPSEVAVARHAAGARCMSSLVALACGHATSESAAAAALDAMARLCHSSVAGGCSPQAACLTRAGAMEAACLAMCRFAASPDVAAAGCLLVGRVATSLPAMLHFHRPNQGPVADACAGAVIAAAAAFRADVRVQQAAAGALWALLMARGATVPGLALRAGAPQLLLSALQDHSLSAECVRNAAAALVCLCDSSGHFDQATAVAAATAHRLVWADRSAVVSALRRHGGDAHLLGDVVTAGAPWAVAPPTDDEYSLSP